MLKKFLFLLIFFNPLSLKAQKQGNIWYFGNHAGLDFNNQPPTPLLNGQTDFSLPNQWNEGCSSISDSSGSLLFYTNGMKVWNNQHEIMPNGNGLLGHSSSTESSIIIPKPGDQRFFYIITTDAVENGYLNGLRYSVVDICRDTGLGDVIPIEKNVKLLDSVAEKLICIPHSNETDYWIIAHGLKTDIFYSYRLTNNGIIDTIISHTGTVDSLGWGGQMIASPNGQKIAYAIPVFLSYGKNFIVDFDASTGIVSNEQILSSGSRVWGVSFSPDNSKLFCSTYGLGEIFQYDLTAGNLSAIIASKTYIIQNSPDSWRHHQLGPDGKIYISRTNKSYLSLIEFPNNLYPACNYIDSAIYLGGQQTSWGLPNLISDYKYYNELPPSNCDTCSQLPPDTKFNYSGNNLIVNFTDQSGDTSPDSWHWDFGDGNTSAEQNPVHVYDSSGVYIVTLIACNYLCCDTAIDTIRLTNVGIEDFADLINTIKIYPNPANSYLSIETTLAGKLNYSVYDIVGKLLLSGSLTQKKNIDVSNFAEGVYVMQLQTSRGTVSMKFVKQN